MENTTENALDFMIKELNIKSAISIATIDHDYIKCMVAYASQITPSVSERIKIVVPSEDEIWSLALSAYPKQEYQLPEAKAERKRITFYNASKTIIKSIRTLNPGAEVVEADQNETF